MMKAMKPAMMDDAIMMIIMVIDMVMMGLAMVMVEMDLEPRKAVNMAEEKKRKIKNVNPDIYKYMDHCHNTYNYHYTHKGNDHI
jgi:nitrate reductase gamma subunit